LRLFTDFSSWKTTRQHDRLFAYITLADDATQKNFNPDYGVFTKEMISRYASAFVKRGDGIDLLEYADLVNQVNKGTSWIPNWMAKGPTNNYNACIKGTAGLALPPPTDYNRVENDAFVLRGDVDIVIARSHVQSLRCEQGRV
jgi:hypothetical protein